MAMACELLVVVITGLDLNWISARCWIGLGLGLLVSTGSICVVWYLVCWCWAVLALVGTWYMMPCWPLAANPLHPVSGVSPPPPAPARFYECSVCVCVCVCVGGCVCVCGGRLAGAVLRPPSYTHTNH
jgi:hypothetical protein